MLGNRQDQISMKTSMRISLTGSLAGMMAVAGISASAAPAIRSFDTGYAIIHVRTEMLNEKGAIAGASYGGPILVLDYDGRMLWAAGHLCRLRRVRQERLLLRQERGSSGKYALLRVEGHRSQLEELHVAIAVGLPLHGLRSVVESFQGTV